MLNSNNVITFPKQSPRVGAAPSLDSIQQSVDMMKHYHIQEAIAAIAPIIFTQLDIAGFPLPDDEDEDCEGHIKDSAFIIESLRAMMTRHYGLYHPFQLIADNVFEQYNDDDNDLSLRIVDELNLNLKNPETE